jgi:eukaryotic-like serine/threonine-protein kinase
MALQPGTKIGAYEIAAPIGAGGMGEVYRATDTNLKRAVAIKVLPESVASNAERLARFRREAEVLASLNHPNIAAIYGLERSNGITAFVMELVEGPTVADRLAQGPIPVEEALPIAKQIAEALEAAHEQGIIHRDLKPANIKVRPDGAVKVLDFGLAKALEPAAAAGVDATASPTITSPAAMTGVGMILGTAAYMSPEQAKGKPADKRSDVWAFGAVLYEILSGRRAFNAEDVSETLAAVLMKEPDWTALPATVPPRVIPVLRRCLQKDRKQRARDIGDVSLALEDAFETAAPEAVASATPPSRAGRVTWVVAAASLAALATMSWTHFTEPPPEQPLAHLSIPLPGDAAPAFLALSPDGRLLAMSYQGGLGLRALDSTDIRPLGGTQGNPRTPFWSPDGHTIAFFADRKLKTVAASGGPPQTLCDDVGSGGGGTWNRDGVILFATETSAFQRVAVTGGGCDELIKAEPGVIRRAPVFLPDGEHFLYALDTPDQSRAGLYAASLADPMGQRLMGDRSSGVFVPDRPGASQGRLLFIREQTLMAQSFDAASLRLSGNPGVVAEQVSFTFTAPQIAASAAMNGTLVYLANSRPPLQLVWYDRSGQETARAVQLGGIGGSDASLAPDGRQVAFRRTDAQNVSSLWLQDLERNQEIRLTTSPLSPGAAVWSPDSQRLVFRATGAGADAMYVMSASGGAPEVLFQGASPLTPSDWSRDDRWLVYTENNPKTGPDLWLLPNPSSASADRTPVPLLVTPFLESQGQISPDGKWLAYHSNESGTGNVYLRRFNGAAPEPGPKWRVSTVRGQEPRWRSDGRELFFLEPDKEFRRFTLISVAVGTSPNPLGTPKRLFEFESSGTLTQANVFMYSPSVDGRRFLIKTFAAEAQPSLEVVLNWGATPIANR